MSLQPGQLLAHYRIERKIGEGGMGEVWAATDTRLNRGAAIKALPAIVATDPERLARFKREAQLLAALSHPNIAGIYGLEEIDGTPYLALELVEGEDLSSRIEGHPVPLEDAIEIALQIAAALEAAHDKGIVHRDLKPANIKIGSDGKVKVLDFGLAKALATDTGTGDSAFDPSRSPTMTAAMGTQAGLILGTAAYMSPEQARGKTVDRRADIWAFGVVLFEMLTGERLHVGETMTDVIAAVVTREPDWSRLPANTPAATRRLLRRCLQKDPRKRLRDIGDAALELAEPRDEAPAEQQAPAAAAPASRRGAWLAGAAGLVLGLILASAIWRTATPVPPAALPTWSTLPSPEASRYDFTKFIEISPDGRKVVFVAAPAEGGESLLWVRDLGSEQPRPLIGTEGAEQPFWSPDSRTIAYFAGRKLRRVGVEGGVSKTLADTGTSPRGGSWGAADTILFVPDWSKPVYRVPAAGGTVEAVTQFNEERLELSHRWPFLLPDGRHFLYFVVSTYPSLNPDNPSEVDKSGLYLGSFDGDEPRLLQTARARGVLRGDTLLYVDDGILMARPFDLAALSFRGEATSLVEGVTQSVDSLWGGSLFSVSDEETLLFVRGAPERRGRSHLRWRGRDGKDLGTVGEPQTFNSVRLSHDGRRAAVSIGDPGDIWLYDLERRNPERFTFDAGNEIAPIWSPDDKYILFQSSRIVQEKRFAPASLFRKAVSGLEPEELAASVDFGPNLMPSDWSPDGSAVALMGIRASVGTDIMLYSTAAGAIEPYLGTEGEEGNAQFSPDGRWLAYESDESGAFEIYVQAYPGPGGKWQVSSNGGRLPLWRADGKELFYFGNRAIMAVPVVTAGGFRYDTPVALFPADNKIPQSTFDYAVTPDGKRFLFMEPVDEDEGQDATVTLLQNWRSLLK